METTVVADDSGCQDIDVHYEEVEERSDSPAKNVFMVW